MIVHEETPKELRKTFRDGIKKYRDLLQEKEAYPDDSDYRDKVDFPPFRLCMINEKDIQLNSQLPEPLFVGWRLFLVPTAQSVFGLDTSESQDDDGDNFFLQGLSRSETITNAFQVIQDMLTPQDPSEPNEHLRILEFPTIKQICIWVYNTSNTNHKFIPITPSFDRFQNNQVYPESEFVPMIHKLYQEELTRMPDDFGSGGDR